MTESEWLIEDNIAVLVQFVGGRLGGNSRPLRLFGCACCRHVWHLLQVEAARRIVELAEAYADGEVEEAVLRAANDSAEFADFSVRMSRATEAGPQLSKRAHNAIEVARCLSATKFDKWHAFGVVGAVAGHPDDDFYFDHHNGGADVLPDDSVLAELTKLLRDIFGNPFRPVSFKPAWRTPAVLDLANQMYKSRDFTAMPILADALQDAGCASGEILSHCRGDGPHVRGCWVVDKILGKE